MKVIQDMLGHSTIQITADTYAHLTAELKKEAADKVSESLFG